MGLFCSERNLFNYFEGIGAVFDSVEDVKDFVAPASNEVYIILQHVDRGLAITLQVKEVQLCSRCHHFVLLPSLGQTAAVTVGIPQLHVGENHDLVDHLACLDQVLHHKVTIGRPAHL